MKWNELSMAQKNELMQIYIKNGVTSLDDMRSHFNSFALGGDKDNLDNPPTDAISGPDRYWEKDPMKSKTGFYEWWLSNRQKQLENAALSKRKHMISMPEFLIRDSKIKQDATQIKDNFIQSIRDYDEFIIPFEGINDSLYKGFNNARVNSIGKGAALRHQNAIEEFIDRPLTIDPNKALNRLRIGAAGVTLPGEKVIYYPEIGLWDNIEKSTIIHERNHAGDYGDNRMVDMIFWDDVNEYGKKFSNYNGRTQPYLLNGIKKSNYYDDAKEIKSRLMEFRYNNNLNPTHTYTIEEIEQMRNNKNTIDENLFNRYSNEFIYHLLNDIAYNNQEKSDEHQAKFGGYLFANGGPKKTYKEWATQMHTKYPWLELDSNKAGYDYEKYFNENYDDAIARLNEVEARHFTDRYKLPNHPTFSDESLYSQGPRYGGTWTKDDKFIPSVINQQQYPNVYNQNREYTEQEIYDKIRHGFATGGPKDPPNKQKMSWFARNSINAAMADNPAYMQAIGWIQDEEGNYHQDPTTEGAKELSKTLAEIGVNAAVDVFGGPILEALAKYGVNQYKGYKNVIKTKKYLSNLEKARDEAVSMGFNTDGTLGDTKLMEAAENKYENLVFGENADITGLSYFKREKPNTRQIGRNAKVVYRGGRGKLPEIQKEHFGTRQEAFNALEEARKEMPITTQDILRNANEDFNSVKSGHTVALVEDYALSKDSYPLLARIAQRRTLHNQGEIIPVIDEGNYRMIKLNKFGVNKKGKQNIDRAIEGLRETTGDKNIPDRVTILGNTYVPAFKFKKYAIGGPKDLPIVLPVNSEGLPYYTLPDLEVTAERLPQAKATDANIQRYANAVANGQLKLTQIPNTELRNRVRAKPIVDQIMRDRDKTLAPILMGTVGMPAAIIGGISAAPTVATIMNNPIVDAGLTIHGAATAPRNIKEGVQEIREGKYGRGALDLGLTALDIWGAGKLAHKAARIANPAYRAKHAYNTIAPASYGDASKRFKEWAKDLWNNPEIDYANPKWLKEAKTKKSIDVERFGYTGTGNYLEDDIVNAGKIADEARQDAWAIYNGLPQVHGTYIKNADGTYSYNMKKIMEDSKGTWHPAHAPLSTGQKSAMHDFVTGAGGGLTDFRLTQTGEHGNGVMHLEDVWDLHPFSRTGDEISQRFGKELIEKIGSQTRRDAVQNFRKKMFDKGIFGLSNKGIQRATYPIDRLLNRYRMGEFAPKFNIGEYESVVGLSDKLIYDLSKSKAMSKLSDKMKSFEVGSISGGKPFKMSTDIPFHRTNPYEEVMEGVGDAEKYYQMSSSGEPIPLQGQLKYGFNPLWNKDLHPVIPQQKYREFIESIVN